MRKQVDMGGNEVFCQRWEESERGWGTRPDGFSLHLSLDGLGRYITQHWASLPDEAPDEYSRPYSRPYMIGVSDQLYIQIEQSDDEGLRYFSNWEVPHV